MKLGIMVGSLGMSQMSYSLTSEVNKMNNLTEYVDAIIFYNRYERIIMPPRFAMLQEQQAWGFDAPVISTDLTTTQRLINCPRPKKKFFYIWNLEWLYTKYNYDSLSSVYLNEEVELIARNEYHYKVIENCWKTPVATIKDFNHEQIIRLVREAG